MVLSELHIPLLSVWERLLKVFKSPGQQHEATNTNTRGVEETRRDGEG